MNQRPQSRVTALFFIAVCSVFSLYQGVQPTILAIHKDQQARFSKNGEDLQVSKAAPKARNTKDSKISTKQTPNPSKESPIQYLQYLTQSGWSNQELALLMAYFVALATDRVLVVPPIVPQMLGNELWDIAWEFPVELPHQKNASAYLPQAYLRTLSPDKYAPLTNIIDFEYTFPNVTVIDYREFFQDIWQKGNLSDWLMDHKVNHINSILVYQRPDLDLVKATHWIESYPVSRRQPFRLYQDLHRLSVDYGEYDVWTILDTYNFGADLHSSVAGDYHGGWKNHTFRFAKPIRDASRMVRKAWGNVPYAAIHVRGGDNEFSIRERIIFAINNTIEDILVDIEDWLQSYPNARQTNRSDSIVQPVHLFVATDLPYLFDIPEMISKLKEVNETLLRNHHRQLQLLSRAPIDELQLTDYFHELEASVIYPLQFLDQQLAGCAEIGFRGTSISTFSNLIRNIRRSQKESC